MPTRTLSPALPRPRLPFSRLLLAGSCALFGCISEGPAPAERIIEVVAHDYAFQVADTVDPGWVTFALRNDGSVLHEMILMKLNSDVTLRDLHSAYQRDELFRPFLDGGNAVLFASAGEVGTGRLVRELEPGSNYVLWCNFSDSEGAPKHARLGMFKLVHVRDTQTRPAQAAANQLIIESNDYAFRAPDTVRAGVTDILIRNVGAQRHEVSLSLLKSGTPAAFFFDQYLKGANLDSLYADDGAVLTAYPGDDNRTAVRVTFVAGQTYIVVCEFRDTPASPTHISLGMFKAIEVAP